MTLTDTPGLPGEIRAALARAGISQEAACDAADIPRTSYYRRQSNPATWQAGELVRLLAAAGYRIRFELEPMPGAALGPVGSIRPGGTVS